MKFFAIIFSLSFSSLFLNGCASYGTSKSWRQEKTIVEPFPIWQVSYAGGDVHAGLRRVHHLNEPHELNFPEAKWGIKYEVLVRHHKYRANPKNRDDGSRESYEVEKVVSETPVEKGTCFELQGNFSGAPKSRWASNFKSLFQPNNVVYQNSNIEKKVVQFFKDEKAQIFVLKGCFGSAPELQINIVEFRYDH